MEGDKTADNEKELTSTSSSDMDKLLTTNNEEKNESNDTLPTSSTDASTSVKSTHLVSDDPISSTSSEMDIMAKSKGVEKASMDVADKASTFENDVELLGMSMTRQPTEQIEENVDDLVSDLETLLGESTASFSLPFKVAEAQDKTEVTSAIEDNQAVIPKDKSENEVSSNTDSSSDKNVNYGGPAAVPVEKTEEESIQNESSVMVEEAAKDIGGSYEFETSTNSSAVKDGTQELDNLTVPDDFKESDSDNIQTIQESSDDLSEQGKKQLVNTNESDLKSDSEACIDDTRPKAAKNENDESCKDTENITVQDDVEKSDQVISREIVGDLTAVAEEPENSCQNQEATESILSGESTMEGSPKITEPEYSCQNQETTESLLSGKSAMEGSPKNTEPEVIEKQPIETIQSKEYLENSAKDDPVHTLNDVLVTPEEIADATIEREESSILCVQTIEESHELTEVISAETVPSNETTQDQCRENPESESAKSPKHEDELQVDKDDIEDTINEKVQREQLNSSLEVQNVQSFSDEKSISDRAIELVQDNNDGAEEVIESGKCASKEEILEEKAEANEAFDDGDVTKAENTQIKEPTNTNEPIELIDTENGSKQSEDAHHPNMLPESSSMIMEERSVQSVEETGTICDVINELETDNQKDDVSENIDMSETSGNVQKTTAVETTETPKECSVEIEDVEKCIKIQSEVSDETFETEVDENSALSDESQPHPQVQTIDCALEGVQAEAPKNLQESQEEDNSANISSPEPVKSSLENPQNIPSEDTEIPKFIKGSQPIHETEEPCQNNQNLQEEIEISELANTSAVADEWKSVVKEPEESAESASESISLQTDNAEIMEISKNENKLPIITEDMKFNQEDQIEIIQTEEIDEDTTCLKSKNVEEAAEISQTVPENSDEVTKAAEVEAIKLAKEMVIEQVKEDIVVDHLNCKVQEVDTSSIITKETDDQITVSDVSIHLENIESNSGTQETTEEEHKIKSDEKSSIPVSELSDEVDESMKILKEPKEIDSTMKEETNILENKIDPQEAESVGGTLTEDKNDKVLVKESIEIIDGSLREATDCQQVAEQNLVALNSDLQKCDAKEVLSDTDVEVCVKQNDTDILKHESYSEESATITEVMREKKTEIITKAELQENVIEKTPTDVTEGLKNLLTVDLGEEQTILTPKLSKDDISVMPIDTDTNEGKKVKKKFSLYTQHMEEIKPIPEINIRRKTVEQDLEKVVCLSEESSSDSDTSEENNKCVPKLTDDTKEADFEQDSLNHDVPLTDDLPPNQEESDLIEIARKVEQLQKVETVRPTVSEIPSEESTPEIVDILSSQHPDTPVDTEENLETILAVASLQNDPVCELKVERRLSEKELREMEAIRMAVASITDSSQDTYDSYLVESSMTMENSIPEVSSDIQEFSSDLQELSSDAQELSNDVQELCDDTQILTESVGQQNIMEPQDDLEKDAKTENRKDSEDVANEEASNAKVADKTDMTETVVSDIKTDITEVSDVKMDMTETEVSDVNTDMTETEVSDIKPDITEASDVNTDMTETEVSDIKTDITKVSDVKTDITEVSDGKTDVTETKVSDVKTSHNLSDGNDHPTANDKDIEQILYPTELKEGLAIDRTRQQADMDDVGEQNKALVPDQTNNESEVNKNEVSLTEQVANIEVSVSKQVVVSNETPEIQSVDRKESLECEDGIAKENTVTASKQVVIEEKVTTPQLIVEDQEFPIYKNDREEKKVTIPEPTVEKQEISPSEKCPKEEEATPQPIVDEGRISKSLPVVQEKDIPPEPVEETKNFASKQAIKEKEITPPKETVEEKKVVASEQVAKERKISEHVAQENEVSTPQQAVEERSLRNRTRRGNKVSEPLSISVEEVEKKEKPYSPKITIKPVKVPDEEVSTTSDAEGNKGSLKITITKQSAKMHSILKVYNPDDDLEPPINQEEPIPKLIIKPKMQQVEQQHSPKMSTRSSKVYSPTSTQRCSSPRITIKPVVKPVESKTDVISPLKITFKPVIKPDESGKKHSPKALKELEQKNHSPKITIKPIPKPVESEREETIVSTPKVTIKPIKRHIEDIEADNEQERSSPKITIKPVVKPAEQDGEHANQTMPKLKIKPIKKHEDEENTLAERDRDSPKISIKAIVKPVEPEEEDEEVKERIVLKINKGNLPTPSKDSRKREYPEDEKTEKIGKLKLKFSTTGGQTHIVQEVEDSCKRQRKDSGYSGKKDPEEVSNKRTSEDKLSEKNKRLRSSLTPDKVNEGGNDDINIHGHKLDSPIVISEDSRSQHSGDCVMLDDSHSNSSDISKIADIASRTTHIEASPVMTVGVVTPSLSPAPKRRGRPRKVPLEVREEHKDPLPTPPLTPQVTPLSTPVAETSSTMSEKSESATPVTTPSPGGRPKRSCRGQNVIATLGIKPRKPRGRGSGRGSKVNMGDREPVVQTSEGPVQTVAMKPEKEPKLTKAKLKLIQKVAEEEAKRQKQDAIKKEEAEESEKIRQREKEEEEERALKEQEEELEKINLELQNKQEEEARLKKQKEEENQQKLAQTILEEEEKRKIFEEQKRSLEVENEKKQKALREETKRLEIDTEQKELEEGLDKQRQKEIEEHKILKAEETAIKLKEETVKRKREEGEGQTPPKKKKEDKTPPRKLEVTTRRQKAQLEKAAEEAKREAEAQTTASEAKTLVGASKNTEKLAEASSSENTSISDTVIVLSDENSSEIKETDKKIEERDKSKERGKKSPEQKGKSKVTPDKAKKLLERAKLEEEKKAEEAREAEQEKAYEPKKIEEQKKAEQERKAEEERRAAEEKIESEKKKIEQKELEDRELEKKKLEQRELENRELEKIALEQKKAEQLQKEQEENETDDRKEDISADDKKLEDETGDKKSEEVSAEEDEESEDSEGEKKRELIKQKKQEAIKKCRAKRMEKRAKAAEIKRKRQEQAAQQRAARIAAEEAERVAAEKSKINRRYGRYGNPKPQISLIDEPVMETEGTIKSHMGLFDPQTDKLTITQPIVIDDDSNFAASQHGADKPSTSAQKLLAPPTPEPMAVDSTEETPIKHRRPIGSEDVMMVDEETRMSADFRGSRAQTPAKQSIPPPETMIEDSQGSIGTESVGGKSKSSKTPKLEVFQDLEATQVSAEQVAEYSWNGRGPFMIQEQVALFLGIKSFKRKYPNCQRRSVDMQERDYLKENGFVTEAQCDLGLTAVNAQDILDIMYADFQDKYEDYCKVQREKQARELANKQKALSQFTFKPGYEKLDIIEQAVQSAAAWNQQFNKTRREERKAHMDLQNLTVHYPKSKIKPVAVTKVGDHPIALVPGQFTDYYKEFTPTELNNLPLNTMCYDEIKVPGAESESDESSSGSDSDSDSDSDSSSSESSCDEDCKECDKHGNAEVNDNDGNDVSMDNNGSNDSVVLVSVTAAAPVTA